MAEQLRWGIIGAGAIADAFARGLSTCETGRLEAVASRTKDKAEKFAETHGADHSHGSYEALLADDSVDIVYVAVPHPLHPEWMIRAAEAGKHVLCEKPMAINHAFGMAMVEAARANNVFLMEAFMYRCHPQTAKLVQLIKEGQIGEVRMIRAAFGFHSGWNPESRLLNNALGGGGILDVGCYPVSASRLIAGAAMGRPFADPIEVTGAGRVGETNVDEWAAAVLKFDHDIVAQVSTAVQVSIRNCVEVFGSEGSITLDDPWVAGRKEAPIGRIKLHKRGQDLEEIEVRSERTSFSLEADACARAIAAGNTQAEPPAMTWDDTLGNLMTLDRWRAAVGLKYDGERPEGMPTPIHGRKLAKSPNASMKYDKVEGIDKPISRFIMGCDNQPNFAHAAVMFDDWFECGGTAFDTAFVYGGGRMEKLLGEWVQSRVVRNDVVILGKGAHTPECYPEALTRQLLTSLERLQTDHVDLYIMHRDNPDVPVGEFVDVLNEHVKAGRIKVFGGSNWSIERFKAANEYAQQNNKQPMGVLSNNLSLAEMVKPVWNGCVHCSDPDSLAWLEKTQTPNFAWSSQARGYFAPEHLRMRLGQRNFESWDSPENQKRRERAEALAKHLGVTAINIAAAYVLSQPFPSFALIGPRVLNETHTALPGLAIELDQAHRQWLNLETDTQPF